MKENICVKTLRTKNGGTWKKEQKMCETLKSRSTGSRIQKACTSEMNVREIKSMNLQ